MRNNLAELPVLLACLWGGAAAGGLVFFIRLPKKIYIRRNRGKRTGLLLRALFFALDITACAAIAAAFAAALFFANGGEPRLYAVSGFVLMLLAVTRALGALLFPDRIFR